MNPKRALKNNTLMITMFLVTSGLLIINNASALPVFQETLSPICRDSSGNSSVFVINNTGSSAGAFSLDYYLENNTFVASEIKQMNVGQSLTIDLSQSAPFADDPFTGYVIISADQPFIAEISAPIPEFPSNIILPLFIIISLISVALIKLEKKKQ